MKKQASASATTLLLVLSRTAGPGTQSHTPANPATGATRSFCHRLAFSNSLELFSYKCEVTYKLQFLINSFALRVLYRDIKNQISFITEKNAPWTTLITHISRCYIAKYVNMITSCKLQNWMNIYSTVRRWYYPSIKMMIKKTPNTPNSFFPVDSGNVPWCYWSRHFAGLNPFIEKVGG